MSTLARTLIFAGLGLVVLGIGVWLTSRAGLPLGRLPGDFSWESGNTRVYVPLTTMLLVSLVLTLVVNLLGRLFG
jgi:hypothetical protein